jgi:hypothetical protein
VWKDWRAGCQCYLCANPSTLDTPVSAGCERSGCRVGAQEARYLAMSVLYTEHSFQDSKLASWEEQGPAIRNVVLISKLVTELKAPISLKTSSNSLLEPRLTSHGLCAPTFSWDSPFQARFQDNSQSCNSYIYRIKKIHKTSYSWKEYLLMHYSPSLYDYKGKKISKYKDIFINAFSWLK